MDDAERTGTGAAADADWIDHPEAVELSAVLLEARGCRVAVARGIRGPFSADLIAHDRGLELCFVTVTNARHILFDLLVDLFDQENGCAAALCGRFGRIEVHTWRRADRGWVCDVVKVGPEDFGPRPAVERGVKPRR